MTALTATELPTERVHDIAHVVCCRDWDGPTFCGLRAAGMAHATPANPECVVCADLAALCEGCPRDGQPCPEVGS